LVRQKRGPTGPVTPIKPHRRGLDILAEIMQHCDQKTNSHLIRSLNKTMPQVVAELKRRLVLFEDLGIADPKGVQRLLKLVTLRDLALALKGSPTPVLENLARNMSQRAIDDLRDEITVLGPRPMREIEDARARITAIARQLADRNELYFQRSREDWVE
jgi:flagellar motor switch protein FliG